MRIIDLQETVCDLDDFHYYVQLTWPKGVLKWWPFWLKDQYVRSERTDPPFRYKVVWRDPIQCGAVAVRSDGWLFWNPCFWWFAIRLDFTAKALKNIWGNTCVR